MINKDELIKELREIIEAKNIQIKRYLKQLQIYEFKEIKEKVNNEFEQLLCNEETEQLDKFIYETPQKKIKHNNDKIMEPSTIKSNIIEIYPNQEQTWPTYTNEYQIKFIKRKLDYDN